MTKSFRNPTKGIVWGHVTLSRQHSVMHRGKLVTVRLFWIWNKKYRTYSIHFDLRRVGGIDLFIGVPQWLARCC